MENIEEFIKEQEEKLPESHLKDWYFSHKIPLKMCNINGKNIYLLTDFTGINDSNYRIFINPESLKFGLEFLDNLNRSFIIEEDVIDLKDLLDNI
ncbi:MAG: hypothetical protein ACI4N3_01525 [Alphaproteobacteria bacterium]